MGLLKTTMLTQLSLFKFSLCKNYFYTSQFTTNRFTNQTRKIVLPVIVVCRELTKQEPQNNITTVLASSSALRFSFSKTLINHTNVQVRVRGYLFYLHDEHKKCLPVILRSAPKRDGSVSLRKRQSQETRDYQLCDLCNLHNL